mmetsp:Transcript_10862/g.23997  ORF Transcript_10862/g.23997 Transcript_10862/m.23997 type:complete len:136 (-) Transcript_10862:978-1385(-)
MARQYMQLGQTFQGSPFNPNLEALPTYSHHPQLVNGPAPSKSIIPPPPLTPKASLSSPYKQADISPSALIISSLNNSSGDGREVLKRLDSASLKSWIGGVSISAWGWLSLLLILLVMGNVVIWGMICVAGAGVIK